MPDQDENLSPEEEFSQPETGQDDYLGNAAGRGDNLSACYAILQIGPDATLDEISAAYDRLKNTWREDRFVQVDAWRGKAKAKLAEIENAYDTILTSLLDEARNSRREPEFVQDEPLPEIPEEKSLAQMDEEPSYTARSHDGGTSGNRRWGTALAAVLLIIGAVTFGLLVWPTLYRYDIIKSGEKVFPLRINRLTSATTYFNGKEWVRPPVPLESVSRPSTPIQPAPPPAAAAVLPSGTAAPPSAAVPLPTTAAREKESRETIPAKPREEAALSMSITAPAPSDVQKASKTGTSFPAAKDKDKKPPGKTSTVTVVPTTPGVQKAPQPVTLPPAVKDKKSLPAPPAAIKAAVPPEAAAKKAAKLNAPSPAAKIKPVRGEGYSIQVRAFQEEGKARGVLREVKARHGSAHIQKTDIDGKGTWYRILIGHFPTREKALAYSKKKGIAESYPGSFIQKTGKGS